MKNVFLNIIKATVSFAKAHTAIAITIASAVAITAVAVPVGVSMAKNDKLSIAPDNVVSAEEIEIIEETIIIDKTDVSSENNSSVEDTTSVEEKPVVSEPTEEPVTSKEEAPSSLQVKPSEPSQTTKPETKPETEPTQNQNSSSTSTSGKTVVQRANTETGISWDGVSPIVYTYADGTTGTEKREGATYEAYPGMISTVVTVSTNTEQTPSKKPRVCDECGKEKGNGGPDTCLRYWTGGGDECPCCGEHVPENTCHTCDE